MQHRVSIGVQAIARAYASDVAMAMMCVMVALQLVGLLGVLQFIQRVS